MLLKLYRLFPRMRKKASILFCMVLRTLTITANPLSPADSDIEEMAKDIQVQKLDYMMNQRRKFLEMMNRPSWTVTEFSDTGQSMKMNGDKTNANKMNGKLAVPKFIMPRGPRPPQRTLKNGISLKQKKNYIPTNIFYPGNHYNIRNRYGRNYNINRSAESISRNPRKIVKFRRMFATLMKGR